MRFLSRRLFVEEIAMAIQIAFLPGNVDGSGSNLLYGIGTLTFSGNYVTGGDTMDFTTVCRQAGERATHSGFRGQPRRQFRVLRAGGWRGDEQLEIEGVYRRRGGADRGRLPGERNHGRRCRSRLPRENCSKRPLRGYAKSEILLEAGRHRLASGKLRSMVAWER